LEKFIYTTAETIKEPRKEKPTYDITGYKIEVDSEGYPTEKGWEQAAEYLRPYGDSSFETARYLFIKKDGTINRHLAFTNSTPDSTLPYPSDKELNEIRDYCLETDTKLIFSHNHPNNYVEPSLPDIKLTKRCDSLFTDNSMTKRFAGHIILDTGAGTYGFYETKNPVWTIHYNHKNHTIEEYNNDMRAGKIYYYYNLDPDKIVRRYDVSKSDTGKKLSELEAEIEKDSIYDKDLFIPVFFLKQDGLLEHLEYISTDSFDNYELLDERLQNIGTHTGCCHCVMLPSSFEQFSLCSRYAEKSVTHPETAEKIPLGIIDSIYCTDPSSKGMLNNIYNRTLFDYIKFDRKNKREDSLDYPLGINLNQIKEIDKNLTPLGLEELIQYSKEHALWPLTEKEAKGYLQICSFNKFELLTTPEKNEIYLSDNDKNIKKVELVELENILRNNTVNNLQFQKSKYSEHKEGKIMTDAEKKLKAYFEEYAKENDITVEQAKEDHIEEWGKGGDRGYGIFGNGYDFDNVECICRIDEMDIYDGDLEAAEYAEEDGFKLIGWNEQPRCYPFSAYRFIDTPENRKNLLEAVKIYREDNYGENHRPGKTDYELKELNRFIKEFKLKRTEVSEEKVPLEQKLVELEDWGTRINVAFQLKEYMPNLSDGERAAAVAILEAGAKSMGKTLTQYIEQTYPNGLFGNLETLGEDYSKQMAGENVKGAADVRGFGEDVSALIYASENADFSTFVHEVAHVWQAQLTGNLKKDAEKAFQVKDGNWKESDYILSDKTTEKSNEVFAYGFELFLKNNAGEFASEDKKHIFEKFADYMSRTYNGLEGNIDISDDIAEVYNSFLVLDDNILSKAEQAVREANISGYSYTYYHANNNVLDPENAQYQLFNEATVRKLANLKRRGELLENLKLAIALEEKASYKNLPPEAAATHIKKLTNWEKDAFGVWKYETDDSLYRISLQKEFETALASDPNALDGLEDVKWMTLGKLLNAGEVYDMLPELKNVKVRFYHDIDDIRAKFDGNGILINTRNLNGLTGEKGLTGVLAHEIQHIIQAVEFTGKNRLDKVNLEKLYNEAMDGIRKQNLTFYDYDVNSLNAGVEAYVKDFGEIEARNVARRVSMSYDRRIHTALRSTEKLDPAVGNLQFQLRNYRPGSNAYVCNYHNNLELHVFDDGKKLHLVEPAYNNEFLTLERVNKNGELKSKNDISEELDNLALENEVCLKREDYTPAIAADTLEKNLTVQNKKKNTKFAKAVESVKHLYEKNKTKIKGAVLGMALMTAGATAVSAEEISLADKQILMTTIEDEMYAPLFTEAQYNAHIKNFYKSLGYSDANIPSFQELETEGMAYQLSKHPSLSEEAKDALIKALDDLTPDYSIADYNVDINSYIIGQITSQISWRLNIQRYDYDNFLKGIKHLVESEKEIPSFEQWAAMQYMQSLDLGDSTNLLSTPKLRQYIVEKTSDIYGISAYGDIKKSQSEVNKTIFNNSFEQNLKEVNSELAKVKLPGKSVSIKMGGVEISPEQFAAVNTLRVLNSANYLSPESKGELKAIVETKYNIDINGNIVDKAKQKNFVNKSSLSNVDISNLQFQKAYTPDNAELAEKTPSQPSEEQTPIPTQAAVMGLGLAGAALARKREDEKDIDFFTLAKGNSLGYFVRTKHPEILAEMREKGSNFERNLVKEFESGNGRGIKSKLNGVLASYTRKNHPELKEEYNSYALNNYKDPTKAIKDSSTAKKSNKSVLVETKLSEEGIVKSGEGLDVKIPAGLSPAEVEKITLEKDIEHLRSIPETERSSDYNTKLASYEQKLKLTNVISFDTETTGFEPPKEELLQISIVNGNGTEVFNHYVKPQHNDKWPFAQKVNHISPKMVKDCPAVQKYVPELQKIFDNADILVSYNGRFDVNFLEDAGIKIDEKKPHLDVIKSFSELYGEPSYSDKKGFNGYKYQKLTTAAAYYGLEIDAHNSIGDCISTLDVAKKIYGENLEKLTPEIIAAHTIDAPKISKKNQEKTMDSELKTIMFEGREYKYGFKESYNSEKNPKHPLLNLYPANAEEGYFAELPLSYEDIENKSTEEIEKLVSDELYLSKYALGLDYAKKYFDFKDTELMEFEGNEYRFRILKSNNEYEHTLIASDGQMLYTGFNPTDLTSDPVALKNAFVEQIKKTKNILENTEIGSKYFNYNFSPDTKYEFSFNKENVERDAISETEEKYIMQLFDEVHFRDTDAQSSEYSRVTSFFDFHHHTDEFIEFLEAAKDVGSDLSQPDGTQRAVEQYLDKKLGIPSRYENGEVKKWTEEERAKFEGAASIVNILSFHIVNSGEVIEYDENGHPTVTPMKSKAWLKYQHINSPLDINDYLQTTSPFIALNHSSTEKAKSVTEPEIAPENISDISSLSGKELTDYFMDSLVKAERSEGQTFRELFKSVTDNYSVEQKQAVNDFVKEITNTKEITDVQAVFDKLEKIVEERKHPSESHRNDISFTEIPAKDDDSLHFTKTPNFEPENGEPSVSPGPSASPSSEPEPEVSSPVEDVAENIPSPDPVNTPSTDAFPEIKKENLTYKDFLLKAAQLETPEQYEDFYKKNFNFKIAKFVSVPPVAENKYQMYIDGKPSSITINGNSENFEKDFRKYMKWAYEKKDFAIFVPTPEAVKKEGMNVILNSIKQLDSLLNTNLEQNINNKNISESASPDKHTGIMMPNLYEGSQWSEEELKLIKHVQMDKIPVFLGNPYEVNVTIPRFGVSVKDPSTGEYKMQEMDGWAFAKKEITAGCCSAIILTKVNEQGEREFFKMDPTAYEAIINRNKELVEEWNKPRFKQTHLQALYNYEDALGISKLETRTNTCAEFFHNFEALCRGANGGSPAKNENEAMEVVKNIYSSMSQHEKDRMHQMEADWMKTHKTSFQDELIRRFYEVRRDVEITEEQKRNAGHDLNNSLVSKHSIEDSMVKGEIDPVSHKKIGDTIRISLTCKDAMDRVHSMPVTEMRIAGANRETNTMVLIDEKNNTQYDLPLDKMIGFMQSQELKKSKELQKQEKQEAKKERKNIRDYSFEGR